MNQLDRIVQMTREEIARRSRDRPVARLESVAAERVAAGDRRPFAQVLAEPGLAVIAEHKRRSP